MLTQWTAGGLSPDLFWDQNFATFNAAMSGAAKRYHAEVRLALTTAWYGEYFAREKRVKPLDEYLPKPILTDDEERTRRGAGTAKMLALFRRKAREAADRKDKDNG